MSLIWRPVQLVKRRARRLDPSLIVAKSRPFPGFTLRFLGANTDVRPALQQTLSKLDTLGLAADWRSTVELVLAETLNNIAEHAYAGQAPGPVTLTARMTPDRLYVILRDQGGGTSGAGTSRRHCPLHRCAPRGPARGRVWLVPDPRSNQRPALPAHGPRKQAATGIRPDNRTSARLTLTENTILPHSAPNHARLQCHKSGVAA